MLKFTNEPLIDILKTLEDKISQLEPRDTLEFEVLNPDIASAIYNGEKINIDEQIYIYREMKSWCDLADILYCKLLLPKRKNTKHYHNKIPETSKR